jgi:hypothetical protein
MHGKVGQFWDNASTFILPKCDSYDHNLLYILELSNESHFECISFKMYIMQLISMKYT